jgi:hypothetical protein
VGGDVDVNARMLDLNPQLSFDLPCDRLPVPMRRRAKVRSLPQRKLASERRTCSSGNAIDSMAPRGSFSNSMPRSATSEIASGIENTPEIQAAAYSPALCPISAVGSRPHDCSSIARAYSIANSAGSASEGASNCLSALATSSGGGNINLRRSTLIRD